MKRYTVSVIANVTIDLIIDAADENSARAIADGMTYDELVDEGTIRIYSSEAIEDQDIKPYEEPAA